MRTHWKILLLASAVGCGGGGGGGGEEVAGAIVVVDPWISPIGVLDPDFGGTGVVTTLVAGWDSPWDVALQSDGKILVTGSAYGTGQTFATVRYAADGALDTTFGGTGKVVTAIGTGCGASGIVVQSDQKVLVAGSAGVGGVPHIALVRYREDGSLDTSFNGSGMVTTLIGARSWGNGIALQPDGKIVVVGRGMNSIVLARYLADGALDTAFNGTGKVLTAIRGEGFEEACDVVIQADGKIVVAGGVESGGLNIALVRYHPDGALDTSFGVSGKVVTSLGPLDSWAYAIALQSDGKIVVGGSYDERIAAVRYEADGNLDPTFNGSGKVVLTGGIALAVALQPDGKILLSQEYGGMNVTRLNQDGSLDLSFNGTGSTSTALPWEGRGLALQPDGRIILVGRAYAAPISSSTSFGVVRYR